MTEPRFCDQCGAALFEGQRKLSPEGVQHLKDCPNRKPKAPPTPKIEYSEAAGRLALEACALFAQAQGLPGKRGAQAVGDYCGDIREREGEGWEGPRVIAWSQGATKLVQALEAAGAFR